MITVCYLCGEGLVGEIDDDHVPPRQFYASTIRKSHNLNLFTLPVHRTCHKPYQKDEDYFVHSSAPLCVDSYAGSEIWKDLCVQFKRSQGRRIQEMVLKEFELRPSGLFLPSGKALKRFDGGRVRRVLWKITRGLFFKEKGQILPESTPNRIKIVSPEEEPPKEFNLVRRAVSKGQHGKVFDYKFVDFDLPKNKKLHIWAMLLWDRLIALISFHDQTCDCFQCLKQNPNRATI